MSDYRDFIPEGESKGALGQGFRDFVPSPEPRMVSEGSGEMVNTVDFSHISWADLRAIAKERGVLEHGMTRVEVEAALQNEGNTE